MMRFYLYILLCLFLISPAAAAELFYAKEKISVDKENTSWVSEWVEVPVPKDLLSFQILAIGSPETLVQVTDLIDPDGLVYVRSNSSASNKISKYDQPIMRNVLSPNRSEAVSLGTGTLLVPNNPTLPIPKPGKWRMRTLSRNEPKKKSISLFFYGKTKEPKNKIPVRVWIANNAWNNEIELDDMLTGAKKIYAEIGLNIEYLSVEKMNDSFFKPLELPIELSQLALKKNNPDAVNVYLMPVMQYQNKGVNGLACLGAPAGIKPQHSCFVSMFENISDSGDISTLEKSRILAHELGHYLGLHHTLDDGYYGVKYVVDSLSDTPEAVTGTNMMDPGTHVKNPIFSPMQIKLMLTSPLLQ